MRAVLLRVRGTLRQHWPSAIVVALIVAVTSGAVLTLTAGARRTASAPAAYTAAVGGDASAELQQGSGPPMTQRIAALPGVQSVRPMTFAFAVLFSGKHALDTGTLSFIGPQPFGSRLVAGRTTKPDHPHEFVADETFVATNHARLGQRFRVESWTQQQGDHGEGFNGPPRGQTFDAVLVGIVETADKLDSGYSIVVFSPSLLHENVGIVATITAVYLRAGVSTKQLRSELDGLPSGREISIDSGRVISSQIRNAVNAQALGTWLMAAVMGVAALIALGQLSSRHARLAEVDRRPLSTIGFTRHQLVAETVMRAAVPVAFGIGIGAAIAVAASRIFPAGFVRTLEPHAGVRVDAAALGIGGSALFLAVLAWVGIASVTTDPMRSRRSLSLTSETIARRAPNPAAATGTRFALTRQDRSNASAPGAIVTLALIVAGIVGTTGFAASLNRLVSDRGRFGSNYSFAIGDNSDLDAAALRKGLQGNPDISGTMILTAGAARAGRDTVELVGVEHVRGDLAPRLTIGRLPTGPDEIALGRVTAHQLHRVVGDQIDLDGPDGHGNYRVVGYAVVPTVGGNDGVGQGGVVTSEGLLRLQSQPDTTMAGIVLRAGAPASARTRIAKRFDVQTGQEDPPGDILNIARVRRVPGFLAALLAALLLLTMFHAVIVSIQSRRRDLAVLKALGADRRWIGRAVHWQASVLTAIPLVVGVPLGLVAGSAAFRAFANRVGAVPEPAIPIALVLAMAIGLLLAANVVAVVPTRRARRLSTAELLHSE